MNCPTCGVAMRCPACDGRRAKGKAKRYSAEEIRKRTARLPKRGKKAAAEETDELSESLRRLGI